MNRRREAGFVSAGETFLGCFGVIGFVLFAALVLFILLNLAWRLSGHHRPPEWAIQTGVWLCIILVALILFLVGNWLGKRLSEEKQEKAVFIVCLIGWIFDVVWLVGFIIGSIVLPMTAFLRKH